MPDPYAPKGWPRDIVGERRGPREEWLLRLTQLGATGDELAAVVAEWADDEYRARVAELLHLGDNEIRAMLREVREEYALGTTTEEEAAAADQHAEYRIAEAEAVERIGGAVPGVLAWVGADLVRAQVVHHLETSAEGANRSTLVRPLQAMLDAD